jgi:DNA-binding XRE family transcriptional regulator
MELNMQNIIDIYRKRLREMMEVEHMSVYDMAREVGIGWHTLNSIMKEKHGSYGYTLQKIKKYFQSIDCK